MDRGLFVLSPHKLCSKSSVLNTFEIYSAKLLNVLFLFFHGLLGVF